jgi:hypothetical protein
MVRPPNEARFAKQTFRPDDPGYTAASFAG